MVFLSRCAFAAHALLLTLFLSFSTSAAVVDNGQWLSDTDTGLDWLKLDETLNLSYNEVLTETQGGLFEGWSIAIQAEVLGFYSSLGSNLYDWSGNNIYVQYDYDCPFAGVDQHCADYIYAPNAYVQNYINFGSDDTSVSLATALVRTSAVPVPAAVWLFGSALFGLAGLKRRK